MKIKYDGYVCEENSNFGQVNLHWQATERQTGY